MSKRIDVSASAREYPDDDGDYQTVVFRAHWNYSDRVTMTIGDKTWTLLIADLRAALNACEAAHD